MDASKESCQESIGAMQTSNAYFSVVQHSDGQVYVHIKQFLTDERTAKCQVNPNGLLLSMHDYAAFILQAKGIDSALQCNSLESMNQLDGLLAQTDN